MAFCGFGEGEKIKSTSRYAKSKQMAFLCNCCPFLDLLVFSSFLNNFFSSNKNILKTTFKKSKNKFYNFGILKKSPYPKNGKYFVKVLSSLH